MLLTKILGLFLVIISTLAEDIAKSMSISPQNRQININQPNLSLLDNPKTKNEYEFPPVYTTRPSIIAPDYSNLLALQKRKLNHLPIHNSLFENKPYPVNCTTESQNSIKEIKKLKENKWIKTNVKLPLLITKATLNEGSLPKVSMTPQHLIQALLVLRPEFKDRHLSHEKEADNLTATLNRGILKTEDKHKKYLLKLLLDRKPPVVTLNEY